MPSPVAVAENPSQQLEGGLAVALFVGLLAFGDGAALAFSENATQDCFETKRSTQSGPTLPDAHPGFVDAQDPTKESPWPLAKALRRWKYGL